MFSCGNAEKDQVNFSAAGSTDNKSSMSFRARVSSGGGRENNMIKTENRVNGYSTNSTAATVGAAAAVAAGVTGPRGAMTEEDPYSTQTCCLVENGRQCTRLAGNACYSKKIQKTVAQRKLKLHMNNDARHIYICDHHKDVIQSLRSKRKRKDSEDDSGETDSEHPEVDLFQLQVNTLRRYKKHYKVHVRQGLNKAQLADCMTRHFKTIPVPEKETIAFFIYMVKTNKSKLDRDHHHRIQDDRD